MTRTRHPADAGVVRAVSESDDDDLLTTAEVAALTRAPVSTVRYWRYLGTGPRGFRIGRRVLYRREEVLRWLAVQEAADPASDDRTLVAFAATDQSDRRAVPVEKAPVIHNRRSKWSGGGTAA
jgi:predicted DNA-binding transcriptional regulator AlpA